jgi:hypothetical protein
MLIYSQEYTFAGRIYPINTEIIVQKITWRCKSLVFRGSYQFQQSTHSNANNISIVFPEVQIPLFEESRKTEFKKKKVERNSVC